MEFLKKNISIIQVITIKKLSLMLPFSKVNLNLLTVTGINPFKPVIDFNMSIALWMEEALKNTHVKLIKKNVIAIAAYLFI